MNTVLKIALGIFLGALLVFAFRVAYFHYVMNEVSQIFSESSQKMQRESQARIKLQQDRVAAQKRAVLMKRQQKENMAKLKKLNADKKDKAWNAYFKDPKECLSYKSEKHMVGCANRRIRAKREFEKEWLANQG